MKGVISTNDNEEKSQNEKENKFFSRPGSKPN
jgi:hypothetical protein